MVLTELPLLVLRLKDSKTRVLLILSSELVLPTMSSKCITYKREQQVYCNYYSKENEYNAPQSTIMSNKPGRKNTRTTDYVKLQLLIQ